MPVVFVDLTLEQSRVLNLALNKISGSWDEELLDRLLKDLNQAPDVDLSLSGFEDDELKMLLKKLDARDKRERPEDFDWRKRSKRLPGSHARSWVTSGCSVSTASCAATPPTLTN